MKIGVSLPVEFLSGIGTSQETEHLRKVYPAAEPMLNELRENGVIAIEIKSMYTHTEPGAVLDAYEAVLSFGMEPVLHGYLPPAPLPERLDIMYPPFMLLFKYLQRSEQELIMVVHSLREEEYTAQENSGRTAEVLEGLTAEFRNRGIPIRFALEINRDHGRPDPSYTYYGVLSMINGPSEAGICFDFGHTGWNVSRHNLPAAPPPDFLGNVIHTHIHDIGPTGTHYPLVLGEVPVHTYVNLLRNAGYSGIFCLELGCYRFADEYAIKDAYAKSLTLLKSC